MKRVLLLCVIGMAALDTRAATGNPPQAVQPFSAVVWTTTTLHPPSGKPSTFTQRTVYTRDESGTVRREIYQPTKGFEHNTTAPLERVLTGSTSAQVPPLVLSTKETVDQDTDLGTQQFSGLPAAGRRQTFQGANGQRLRPGPRSKSASILHRHGLSDCPLTRQGGSVQNHHVGLR